MSLQFSVHQRLHLKLNTVTYLGMFPAVSIAKPPVKDSQAVEICAKIADQTRIGLQFRANT